jgi:asparagine synthetase B (glutamine-hydrolysing)
MCGIHVSIRQSASRTLDPGLKSCLCNRGPDHFGQAQVVVDKPPSPVIVLTFTSTVLSLRGNHITKQPFVDDATGSVLCWNGEAWRLNGRGVDGNDGEAVFRMLTDAASQSSNSIEAILEALRSIEGPFAFVFFDKPNEIVFYGRDRLGRRSLLLGKDEDASLTLASIAARRDNGWVEVEADGIYSVDLHSSCPATTLRTSRHSWVAPESGGDVVSTPWLGKVSTAPHIYQAHDHRSRVLAGSACPYRMGIMH